MAKKDGLIQPYKVVPWDAIPANTKDADGYWYGDYYGVVSFEVNTDIIKKVPKDWADLQAPDYKHSIALAGDPRTSNQAIQAIFAAGLSVSGGKFDQAGDAGLKFFADLNKAGNFVPTIGKTALLAKGVTPIILRWDYNALADRDNLKSSTNVQVVVPRTGVVAGFYVQAISAYAPHPNAAKLWMEYLYSLDGQLGFLKGYCHPIRFTDLLLADMISDEMNAALPPETNYDNAVFPTIDQQAEARDVITKQWDSVVGANVK